MPDYVPICATCKYCDLEYHACTYFDYYPSVDPSGDACGEYVSFDSDYQ